MPRRLIRRYTRRFDPAVAAIVANPTLRRVVPALTDPDLWYLNRRSTARAVALGLFCGLIPGPLQIPAAVLLCPAVRANLPLAVVTTFYSNPFTIVPLYLVAWRFGRLFVDGNDAASLTPPPYQGLADYGPAVAGWMAGLGAPLALGLLLLALTLAALGWAAVRLAWRVTVVVAWRRRGRRRALA